MKVKRVKKRNTSQPHTKIVDWGLKPIFDKIDKSIKILEKKKRW